ncbi:MAG: alpha/beta hydrolase family protein [Usitatibacter sp.]
MRIRVRGLRALLAAAASAAATLFAASASAAPAPAYDPLLLEPGSSSRLVELTVHDNAPVRNIPILVYLPAKVAPAPVILFSHGLGGSKWGSSFLGRHWSQRGYVAVFLQHPGSDEAVWRDEAVNRRMGAMRDAATPQNFTTRVKDVRAVLDQLQRWNADKTSLLLERLDMKRVGMSGHSFGALTTQAVSGERFAAGGRMTDPRIKAAIVMSPSIPRRGDAGAAFGGVSIPWLLMTGTEDNAPIGESDAASRRKVFPALPPGRKYELVLDKAEHSAFTERPLPGDREPRNPNHHRAILALSTAFWDAYLGNDAAARAWLDGPGAKSVLEAKDSWKTK